MLKKLFNRWGGDEQRRNPPPPKFSRADKKLFAAHQRRDAELGCPTTATLNDRLSAAAQNGHWKTAMAAVAQGADANYVILKAGFCGAMYTPVSYFAIEQDRPEELKQLLQAGADRFAATEHVLLSGNSVTFATSLLNNAAQKGSAAVMKVLLDGTAWPQGDLDNALRLAASRKDMAPAVKQLLAHGAQGYLSALHAAEGADNRDVIRLLCAAEKDSAAADLRKDFPGDACVNNEAAPPSASAVPDYALQKDLALSRPLTLKSTK